MQPFLKENSSKMDISTAFLEENGFRLLEEASGAEEQTGGYRHVYVAEKVGESGSDHGSKKVRLDSST